MATEDLNQMDSERKRPNKRAASHAQLSFEQQWYRNTMLVEHLWVEKAKELTEAAAKLENSIAEGWSENATSRRSIHALLPIYLMLSAYAVENLLKAMIIMKNKDALASNLANTHRLPEQLRSHDLFALARAAGTNVLEHSEAEELLRRMSRSAVWYGRYPVPLSAEGFKPRRAGSGELQFLNHLSSDDVARVKQLVRFLLQECGRAG